MRFSLTSALILLLVVSASARIINVPEDYAAIQAGIDASQNGDTVLVRPGIYIESLNIAGKNIFLTGLFGSDSTRIDGRLTIGPDVDTTNVVRGFYFGSIEINDAAHIAIVDCSSIIEGNVVIGSQGIATGAISLSNSNSIIRSNIIQGIYGVGSAYVITISGGYPVIEYNLIRNNAASFPEAAFLSVIWMNSGILRYNVINNNSASGNIAGIRGVVANGNSFEIKNNTIVGNLSGSFNSIGAALEYIVPSGGNGVIKNNIIAFNRCEMGVNATILDSSWAGWDYNLVYGNRGENYHNMLPGPHDIQDNPLFNDSASQDYHLSSNSPCIDAGDPSFPLDPDSTRADIGAYYFSQSVGINDDRTTSRPHEFTLGQNYPNPFNAQTIISYYLEKESEVSLRIYAITGHLILSLIDNELQLSGEHRYLWDGKDSRGRMVSTGIYFYELYVDDIGESKAMIMLR